MHITVLNGSPRPAGNTEIMADALIKDAPKLASVRELGRSL